MAIGKQAYIGTAGGPYVPGAPGSSINQAVIAFNDEVVSGLVAGAEDDWFIPYSYTPPATGLITIVNYPVSGTKMQDWKGTPAREELGSKQKSFGIDIKQMGAHADSFRIRAGDTSHWSQAPDAMYLAARKVLGISLGEIWTDAKANPNNHLNSWGQPWLQVTPSVNLNNPFKTAAEMGTYYNLTVSTAFTEANILAAAIRLEQRAGTDGRKLGLKAKYLVVPWAKKRQAENLVHKLILVANAAGTAGGITSTITNEFEVLPSIEMPDNFWGIWADMSGFSAKMKPFVVLRGVGAPLGNVAVGTGALGAVPSAIGGMGGTPNLDGFSNTGLPEYLVEFWGTNSALYETTKKVAVDIFTINSIAVQDGRLMEMCTTDA